MFNKIIIGGLISVFSFFGVSRVDAQEVKPQPAGIIGAVEFTDVARTAKGDGIMGQKTYVGLYYKVKPKFVAVVVGEYSENDLSDVEKLIIRNAKFTATYDVATITYPFKMSVFLIGSVGNTWVTYSDASISTLLTSTGIGFKFPVKTSFWGFHFRMDSSKEYRQYCVGLDYALPFYTNQ